MRALLTLVAGVGTAGFVGASYSHTATHHVSPGFEFWCAVGAGVCMGGAMWLLVTLFRNERTEEHQPKPAPRPVGPRPVPPLRRPTGSPSTYVSSASDTTVIPRDRGGAR